MNAISLKFPKKLFFGVNCSYKLLEECQKNSVKRLFVLVPAFLKERVIEILGEPSFFESMKIFAMDSGEPSFQYFEEVFREAKLFDPDGVIGIGGGSVMDTAKLLAALLKENNTWDKIIGNGKIRNRNTWLACLPTTAGTGSEVSPNAIFLDKRDGNKKGVISDWLVPDAAFVDPLMTVSVPPFISAYTGMDALIHCLEAYFNKFSHPMVDLYAVEGIKLIIENLGKVVIDGKNIHGRSKVALGSMYGGMCLGPVNTAGVHALAYPLGSLFGIPHGLSTALMLLPVLKFNLKSIPQRFSQLALMLGIETKGNHYETGLELIRIIEGLVEKCHLPSDLSKLNVPEEAIPQLASEAMKVERLLKNNPRTIGRKEAEMLYREAF